MIWRAPISVQIVWDNANSIAGNVGEPAVTATARASSTSCATFRTSVLSMPPENATSTEPMSPMIVLRQSRASVPPSLCVGDDIGVNLGFGQVGDDDQGVAVGDEILLGRPQDVLFRHRRDRFGIIVEIAQAEAISFNQVQQRATIRISIQTERNAPDQESFYVGR